MNLYQILMQIFFNRVMRKKDKIVWRERGGEVREREKERERET